MSLLCTLLLSLIPADAAPSLAPAQKSGGDKPQLQLEFGVYQSDKATVMYRKLSPVLEWLQNDLEPRLGRSVDIHLTIFKSYEEGINNLVNGRIDFVRFGPASYINAKKKSEGVQLIAMELEN